MEIKSVNDLKAMDPQLLKKLGIRKVNANDIAKLGLRIFNAGDIAKLNTRPFTAKDLAKFGLKNFYTEESVEHWLKNFTFQESHDQNSTQQTDNSSGLKAEVPDQPADKSKTAGEANISKEAGSEEQCNVIRKRRPYPRRGWPFLWGHPAFRRTRKTHFSADPEPEEKEEILSQDKNSGLSKETPEPTPRQTDKIYQKADTVDLAEGENSKENVPIASEKSAGDQDELQEAVINSQDNSGGNSKDKHEENSENISEQNSDNNDTVSDEGEENKKRIFQLESIKKGIEIKSNPYKVIPLKVCIPKAKTN
ncbi:hypothetical protein [Desulfoscipio geothermicus]|uniref:Uncharacterized protein n=1 Tax=Desulfoscipio geothermicus DSM 3669 TaxID=1121426 RepID=A0A1I6DTY0_9FIRM|nr:hypothetical protein [Desulfoscipio geothermicus]SFR08812.1 hypothetical protein SAMN05660706_11761 [Desulfoscipio geothermicus DSM 3669]